MKRTKKSGMKCVTVKHKGGKSRKQCARVLASGKFHFVKNSSAGCHCGK